MELNLKAEKTMAISCKRNKLIEALEKKLQATEKPQVKSIRDI